MKRVLVKSVFDAFEYVMQHYAPPEMEEMAERTDTYAVISIQDTNTGGFGVSFTENRFCRGVLELRFDDVTRAVEGAVAFDETMAERVIDFICAQQAVDTLLVHCYAGQSRSRAVGAFAVKMLGGNNESSFTKHSPNMLVYDTLMHVWERRNGKR